VKPLPHVAASGIISAISWFYFKSFGYCLITFLSGILIDADHLLDYALSYKFTFNARKIYEACKKMELKKFYIVLHSFEIVIILWAAIYIFSLSKFWQAIALGLTQHIVLDQLTNPIRPLGYFFIYRFLSRFEKEKVLKI